MTGKRRVTDEQVECECWCGLAIVDIPARWVGERTDTCGAPGCNEDGKYHDGDDGDEGDLIDLHEAAELLGVTLSAAKGLVLRGRLASVGVESAARHGGRPGRRRNLFVRSAVERLAKERRR